MFNNSNNKNEKNPDVFKTADFFMLRGTLFPIEEYEAFFDRDNSREKIEEAIINRFTSDGVMRRDILVSSLSLYKELNNISKQLIGIIGQ